MPSLIIGCACIFATSVTPALVTPRQTKPVSFSQAIDASPSLARLNNMVRESSDLLKMVERLLPQALRIYVKAGPIENEAWCLLVSGNAAAAKVRQLVPALLAHLQSIGSKVTAIRIKVLIEPPRRFTNN